MGHQEVWDLVEKMAFERFGFESVSSLNQEQFNELWADASSTLIEKACEKNEDQKGKIDNSMPSEQERKLVAELRAARMQAERQIGQYDRVMAKEAEKQSRDA